VVGVATAEGILPPAETVCGDNRHTFPIAASVDSVWLGASAARLKARRDEKGLVRITRLPVEATADAHRRRRRVKGAAVAFLTGAKRATMTALVARLSGEIGLGGIQRPVTEAVLLR